MAMIQSNTIANTFSMRNLDIMMPYPILTSMINDVNSLHHPMCHTIHTMANPSDVVPYSSQTLSL
jgi:hypothetical protein